MRYIDGRYHKDVCWCLKFYNILNDISSQVKSLIFTNHIHEKHNTASERKYDKKRVTLEKILGGEVIEVHIANGQIDRFLVRFAYDSINDMIGAFSVKGRELIVVTLWLNGKKDEHSNLDRSLYQKELPEEKIATKSGAKIGDLLGTELYEKLLRGNM